MTCDRIQELLIDALVQPLGSDELQELHAHLDTCGSCAEHAARLERLWSSLETVAIPEPHPDAATLLMQAVDEEFGSEIKHVERSKRLSPVQSGWRAAAALVLVVIGSLLTIATQSLLDQDDGSPGAGKSRYMLIMTEMDDASIQNEEAQQEFSDWINDLVDRGVMETGIGLADLPPVGTPPGGSLLDLTVNGVIVIYAEDAQEARRIAVSSPVITYGGFIEIRELSGNASQD